MQIFLRLKSIFIIFYKSESIEVKLKKIFNAFAMHHYSLPDMDNAPSINHMLTENALELVDLQTVLMKNQNTHYYFCQMMEKHTESWTWIILHEKAIYCTLNQRLMFLVCFMERDGSVLSQ